MIIETTEVAVSQGVVVQPAAVSVDGEAGADIVMPAVPRGASENPYHVYIAGLKNLESQRKMKRLLDQVACMLMGVEYIPGESGIGALFPWEQLRWRHTAAVKATLIRERDSASTINASLTAMRKALQAAWKLELMTGEDYYRARDVDDIKVVRVPAGRSVDRDEVLLMRNACVQEAASDGNALLGTRDSALIALLWSTGLREAEAASVRVSDFDAVGRWLKVLGKGNKQRRVPVHANTVEAIQQWLDEAGITSGHIFRRIDKWGHVSDRPLSTAGLRYIVERRRTGADLRKFTPHDLRRTFIGDILDHGAHVPQAQKLAGHVDANTTSSYVRHNDRALQAAVDRLPVPSMVAMDDGGEI
jgi:integrase